MNSVPFRPKQTEFLVLIYNLKPEYRLFHLGSISGQFQWHFGHPGVFRQIPAETKDSANMCFGFPSHFTVHRDWRGKKKKIQVMDKAQVLPLKLTSSSLCLCHFQREKVRVWDFYEALNKNALECDSAKHPLRIYLVRELQQSACDSIIEKIMQLTCVESNVMNSVPFRPKQMEFLVPVYNLKPEYPLFHLGSKSG